MSTWKERLALFGWWWLALFGIWPLAHPAHTTFGSPTTWIDLVLHAVGLSAAVPLWVRLMGRWYERQIHL